MTIMLLGIFGLLCCGIITGIPAIVMGNTAKKEVEASGGTVGGDGKIMAGIICGWIAVGWTALAVLYWLFVVALAV